MRAHGGRAALDKSATGAILDHMGGRSLVLVGMPGAGKSTIGRRLAARLSIPFVDADAEIEQAAGMSIADIFAVHGEPAFRDGEKRVIARLLDAGPQVLATGGGAFMNPRTREAVKAAGISIWLQANLDTLFARVRRRGHRPMLAGPDARQRLGALLAERDPVYETADIAVVSAEGPHERVVDAILERLAERAEAGRGGPAPCP